MQRFRLDAVAIGLSSLCMIHCVASLAGLFAIGLLSAFGRVEELFHLVMLAIIVPVSLLAIGMGVPPTSLDLAVDAMWLEGTLTVSSQDTEYGTAGDVLEGKSAEAFTGYPR